MPALILTSAIYKKVQLFFIPYLVTLIGLCAIYTSLNWLLIVRFQVFQIHEHLVELVGPGLLSGLIAILYITPKLKYLKVRFRWISWESLYYVCLFVALAVPIGATQVYLRKASGQLTEVSDITQIPWRKSPKYLSISKHYVQKKYRGTSWSATVSGRRYRNFNMHIYVVMPILSSEDDIPASAVQAWLGKSYDKTISRKLTTTEKVQLFKAFIAETELSFRNENFDRFDYLERVGYNLNLDGYMKALRNSSAYRSQNGFVLEAVNGQFKNRLNGIRDFTIRSYAIFPILWLILILIPGLNPREEEPVKSTPTPAEIV
jgi:rhomboid protease GluP